MVVPIWIEFIAARNGKSGCRIELTGIGKMFEQFGELDKTLPVVKALRQHVGRQRFRDYGIS